MEKSRSHNQIVTDIGPLEHVPLSALKPNPRNSRKHNKRQIKLLARSIEAFRFVLPIVINASNEIICGNAVYMAAQQLGLSHLPAIRLSHLNEDEVRAFGIAHNRLAEHSTWDSSILGEFFVEFSGKFTSFDVEDLGFSTTEIDLHIGLTSDAQGQADPPESIPVCETETVTRPGDMWLLGPHRLLCDSALDQSSWQRLMDGAKAALVVTDPPYNVPIKGHVSGNGEVIHREFVMASGEMSKEEFSNFLESICQNLVGNSTDGSLHYLFMDWRHLGQLLAAGEKGYSQLVNFCVWVKPNGGMGSFYRSRHELVAVFKNGKAAHRNNVELGRHGRNRTNVWEYAGATSFSGRKTDEGNLLELHPTVKPISLIADVILDASRRGEIITDPFLGSGSTLLAAQRTGRRLYGIELDARYVDVAIRRWQNHTGEQAVLASNGKSFDAIAEGRRS